MNSNKCLIFEVYRGNSFNTLNESQTGVPEGMMRVTGVAAVIGVKNRNGRVYTKDNYIKHINLLQPEIEYGLYGELEHPDGFTINNNNISHKIEKVWFNPVTNEVMITILILDTPKGKIAQSIIKSGGTVRVSSRAMGSVGKGSEATIDKLVTYDIVGTPGFKETQLHLTESMKSIHSSELYESFYMTINEEIDESPKHKNIQLLESKIKQLNESDSNTKMFDNIQNWCIDTLCPLWESYTNEKQLNESFEFANFRDYVKSKISSSSRGI